MAQPGLAAVLAAQGFPSLRVSVVGLVAAAAGFLAVFSLNDVLDRHVDAVSLASGKAEASGYDIDTAFVRHPLARGDLSLRFALSWVLALGVLSAVLAWWLSPVCLLLFAGAVALECLYCALRSVTVWKTLVSGAMVGIGGLAGWAAVKPLSVAALSVFLFLALWEIGGRNLANDLADVESDRRVGIKTVATVYGPQTAARAACVVGFATLASSTVLPLSSQVLTDVVIGVGLVVLAWPGAFLWHNPTPEQAASYFNRASLFPALVLLVALLPALFGAL